MNKLLPLPVPEPDAKNPLPIVLAKDGVVVLSFMSFVARTDVHVLVTFLPALAHRASPPEKNGPKPGGTFEVEDSSWARSFPGGKGRHYLFAFPDMTFECVAEGFGSETINEDEDAVRLMARRLYK